MRLRRLISQSISAFIVSPRVTSVASGGRARDFAGKMGSNGYIVGRMSEMEKIDQSVYICIHRQS